MTGLARLLIIFMVFCCFLMLMAGSGLWWLPLPLMGVGLVLLVPVVGLLVICSPLIAVVLIIRGLLTRSHTNLAARPVATHPAPATTAQSAKTHSTSEPLIAEGEAKVDLMRNHARRISKPVVRAQALEICALADRILAILPEAADEQTIRDVINRYLAPAEAIVSRYTRLMTRGVASAAPTLDKVEAEDFPLIERQLHELYDRLNRGDLIDLEVAREMLRFDFPTAPLSSAQT